MATAHTHTHTFSLSVIFGRISRCARPGVTSMGRSPFLAPRCRRHTHARFGLPMNCLPAAHRGTPCTNPEGTSSPPGGFQPVLRDSRPRVSNHGQRPRWITSSNRLTKTPLVQTTHTHIFTFDDLRDTMHRWRDVRRTAARGENSGPLRLRRPAVSAPLGGQQKSAARSRALYSGVLWTVRCGAKRKTL